MFCHIVRNSYSSLPLSTIINLNKAKRAERSLDCARDDNMLPSSTFHRNAAPHCCSSPKQ